MSCALVCRNWYSVLAGPEIWVNLWAYYFPVRGRLLLRS